MPTTYTSLLGFALPATGELGGTWGTVVNDYITQYVDAAVAGAQTISGSQTAVTLSTTNGSSLTQAGSGATGSSQYAIINCTGNPASQLTVTAPATSKAYLVINATSTSQSVKVVGAGPTTGVTVAASKTALIAWNGTDFQFIAVADVSVLQGLGTGVATALAVNTGTAGAFVVNGGALGTPLSGTVTNLTGTASININGTVGATTPNTGAFTSVTAVSASGVQTRAAATQDGIRLIGRAGGTSNWEVALTPTTLTADRTLTLPDATTTVAGTDATQTLTNKRVTPRVSTTASSATPTINTDTTDVFGLTAQTVDITSFTTNLSGTPTDGQLLRIYIVGTAARAITWGASFEASTVALPTTTVSTNRLDVGFVWNAATSKWRCLATA